MKSKKKTNQGYPVAVQVAQNVPTIFKKNFHLFFSNLFVHLLFANFHLFFSKAVVCCHWNEKTILKCRKFLNKE